MQVQFACWHGGTGWSLWGAFGLRDVLGLLVIYIGRLLVKTSRVEKAVRQTTRIKQRKIRVSFLGLF